jgi:hypothetical protein
MRVNKLYSRSALPTHAAADEARAHYPLKSRVASKKLPSPALFQSMGSDKLAWIHLQITPENYQLNVYLEEYI